MFSNKYVESFSRTSDFGDVFWVTFRSKIKDPCNGSGVVSDFPRDVIPLLQTKIKSLDVLESIDRVEWKNLISPSVIVFGAYDCSPRDVMSLITKACEQLLDEYNSVEAEEFERDVATGQLSSDKNWSKSILNHKNTFHDERQYYEKYAEFVDKV